MLQLLVMRHAKSSWDDGSEDDHDRTLAPRGIKAAATMGRFLAETGYAPQQVISSTAVRAITTVELAFEAGGWNCPVSTTRELYGSGPHSVLEVLVDCATEPRVLIAGHEPTWSTVVAWLTGGGSVRMPTAAVACIEFHWNQWSHVTPGSGELRWLVTPKLLQRIGWPEQVKPAPASDR